MISSENTRVKPLCAFGAEAMTELSLRVLAYVQLDLVPVSSVVADLFAGGTDGKKPAQGLDLAKGLLQFPDQVLALALNSYPMLDLLFQRGIRS